MNVFRGSVFTFAAFAITSSLPSAAQNDAPQLRAADIVGDYELVDRVLANGAVLKRPDIAGLYTMSNGRANLNLFIKNADGTLASESSIVRYTLTEENYCEWIEYTIRNDFDAPGLTNALPSVASHCTPIRVEHDKVVFAPPGESVTTTYDRYGFTAIIEGQFTDHWKRID